jgi:hypothetical protein
MAKQLRQTFVFSDLFFGWMDGAILVARALTEAQRRKQEEQYASA